LVLTLAVAILLGATASAQAVIQPPQGPGRWATNSPGGPRAYNWQAQNPDGTFTSTSRYISDQQYADLLDYMVSAGDEAVGRTIPSDIRSGLASAGSNFWDGLHTASTSVKTAALDGLQTIGDWSALSTLGDIAPAVIAGGGAFYLGWTIGGQIADLLGLTENGAIPVTPGSGRLDAIAESPVEPGATFHQPNGCGTGCVSDVPFTTQAEGFVTKWRGQDVSGNPVGPLEVFDIGGQCGYSPGPTPGGVGTLGVGNEVFATGGSCDPGGSSSPQTQYGSLSYEQAQVQSLPGPGQGASAPATACSTQESAGGAGANTGPCSGHTTPALPNPTEAQQRQGAKNCASGAAGAAGCALLLSQICSDPASPTYGQCTVPASPPAAATIVIPQPTDNETFDEYKTALIAAGITGTITNQVLNQSQANPSVAPNDVVTASPAPGTEVAPQTDVQVETNPASVAGGGAGAPPSVTQPGINLPQAGTPCTVFPFGIPCWMRDQLAAFTAAPVAPHFAFGAPAVIGGGTVDVNVGTVFGVDISSIMAIARPLLLAAALISIVIWLGGMAMGGSTSSGVSGGGGE
jgi:hypothetical protein